MRDREHKGSIALERYLLENNPILGEHIRDARIIRSNIDYRKIEAAKERCEARRALWRRGG